MPGEGASNGHTSVTTRARVVGFGLVLDPSERTLRGMFVYTRWRQPARTVKTLENRLFQVKSHRAALYEIQRFVEGRCGARTRLGRPCRRKGLENGRCRNHGGLSTGPRTPEGRRRSLQNLKQYRDPIPQSRAPASGR